MTRFVQVIYIYPLGFYLKVEKRIIINALVVDFFKI